MKSRVAYWNPQFAELIPHFVVTIPILDAKTVPIGQSPRWTNHLASPLLTPPSAFSVASHSDAAVLPLAVVIENLNASRKLNWRWGWVRNWEPPGKMDGSHWTVQYFIMCRKLVVLCISTLDPKSDSEAGWWHEKCSRPRGGSVEQWVAIFFLHLPSASAWETCYLGISSKEWQVHHPCLTILNNSCMVPISPFHFE